VFVGATSLLLEVAALGSRAADGRDWQLRSSVVAQPGQDL
jgi:hypothetical protein